MGKGNTAMKRWFQEPERFADLFNGHLFGGQKIILPKDLVSMDTVTEMIVPGKNDKNEAFERRRDIFMRWKKGANLILLGCENQDKIHYAMPIRNMLYDGLQYTDQVVSIKKKNMKNKMNSATKDEFLSGLYKDDKIFPIITLVFYYGENPWDAAIRLHDLFPTDILETDILKTYVPDYKINLIDAGNVAKIENFHTDLQQIFGMLKCRGNKNELIEYIRNNNQYFSNIDENTYHVIREFLHSERILKNEIGTGNGKEQIDMCKALEDLYNDGVTKGIEQGIRALIVTCKKFGSSKEEIYDEIVKNFSVTFDDAKEFVEKYMN